MADITTRETSGGGATVKGSPLTNAEVDTNFINLQTDKIELTDISVAAEPDPSGDGSLAYNSTTGVFTYTPPADIGGAVTFTAQAGEALSKGDVVYVSGVSGNTPVVSKADADDANKMPAYGLAEASASLNAAVNVVTFGTLYELDTSGFSAGDTVYVSTTAGSLTNSAPTGESSLIQNIGMVVRSHASAGSIKVGGAGRTNATPNLDDGNVFIGNASNQAEARALTGDDISGGTITSFASTGIDDNATGERLTITDSGIAIGNTGTNPTPINGTTAVHATASSGAEFIAGTNDTVISSGAFMGGYVFRNADSTGSPPHYSGMWAESADTSGNMNLYFAAGSTGYETGSADLTIDSSGNTTFAGTITSGDITVSDATPFIRLQDSDITNGYTQIANTNGNAYIGARNDTADGIFVVGGYGGGTFTEWARWSDTGNLTQKNNLIVQGTFTSLGIDDNATSTAITIDSSERTFFNSASNRPVSVVSTDTNSFVSFEDANSASVGHVKIGSETNDMVFYANAQERMRIKGANVGIGTTSPDQLLDVGDHTAVGNRSIRISQRTATSGLTYGGLEFYMDNTAGTEGVNAAINYATGSVRNHGELTFHTGNAASTGERVRINYLGNVGIGTTNPSDGKLQIAATAEAGVFVRDSSASNAAPYIRVQGKRQDGNGSESFAGGLALEHHRTDAAVSNNKALGTIYFGGNHTDGSESNIAYGASIVAKAEGTFNSASDMPMGLAFFTGSTGRDLGTANVDFGSERMRIDNSGNVGIGTDAPDSNLHIAGSAAASLRLERNDTTVSNGNAIGNIHFEHQEVGNEGICATLGVRAGDNNGSGEFVFYTGLAGTTTERLRIDSSGNLLVGKTATGLNTAGTEFTTDGQMFATSSNVIAGYFNRQGATGTTNLVGFRVANSDAGTIQSSAGGTPAFAAASDQRLKDNVTNHESELSNVMALRPVRWDWKDETKGAGEGFVAQELEQTAWADLVSEGEDGYKMVSGLGAVETRLIKALQEAVTRIETLEAEVAALKGA